MRSATIRVLIAGALALLAATAHAQALRATRFAQPGPLLDPAAAVWRSAREVAVPLLPQVVTTPTNPDAAVKAVKVRAVHNGQWLALRLEWPDPTKNDLLYTDRFGDQAAVQFPLPGKDGALASPMMGHKGARVNILQWRAAFQRDVEQAERHGQGAYAHAPSQLRELYPNALVDLYPDQVLRATDARPYLGALGMDNPVSHARLTPVLDQMAEGWGTLTVKPEQLADGRGAWANGAWKVVIALPLASGSANSPQLAPGAKTMVAFAVWEGANSEVGARKAWSAWVPLELAR